MRSFLVIIPALIICFGNRLPGTAQQQNPESNSERVYTVSLQSYLNRGLAMLNAGQSEQSMVLFKQYVRLRPNDPRGYFYLGQAQAHAGDSKAALDAYDRSLKLAQEKGMDSAELRVNIANSLFTSSRVDDAVFNYKRAIEIDPALAYAHYNLGRALIARGQAGEALEEFDKCSQLGSTDPTISYYRGLCLLGMGKKEDARNQMLLFMKNMPDTPQTRELKMQLERHL